MVSDPDCPSTCVSDWEGAVLKQGDVVIGRFLDFLDRDIANNPDRLQPVDAGLVQRLNSLVGNIDVDLDAELSEPDE